ncbi:MAG: hypothetical protein ACP5QO_09110 [Clostridia bacterium]
MPDLALGNDRPFTLVTTAVCRGPAGHTRAAQVDIHLTSADVRLRFTDTRTLHLFCEALEQLRTDLDAAAPFLDRRVQTRVYSEENALFF